LFLEFSDLVAQTRGGFVVFSGDGLLHLASRGVESTSELTGRQRAGRSATDMSRLMLDLAQQAAQGIGESLPARRATEATSLAEIDVRKAALGTGQRRGWGSGREGVGELKDGRIGRPALLGATLAEMHLRDVAVDDLGEVDRGGLLAERTLNRLGHLASENGKEANWQGQAGRGV